MAQELRCYVYFKAPADDAAAVTERLHAERASLLERALAVQVELLRRPEVSADGQHTWMVVLHGVSRPAEVTAWLAAEARPDQAGGSARIGTRHVEWFDVLPASSGSVD